MNAGDVMTLVANIRGLWPTVPFQTKVDTEFIRLWQIVLADVPLDAAQVIVAGRSRAQDPFPPPPGVIAGTYIDARDSALGLSTPDADKAWAEVMGAVRHLGYAAGPPALWSHPAVADAVRAIGWSEICQGDAMITRAHFVKMYPAIAERHRNARVTEATLLVLGIEAEIFRRPPEGLAEGDPS